VRGRQATGNANSNRSSGFVSAVREVSNQTTFETSQTDTHGVGSATNVFNIAELADLDDPPEQVLYYGLGVGTLPAPNARTRLQPWASKVIGGGGLGHGMRRDVDEAYTYLMNVWQPGDRVYVFGFSRGAYTARALRGMLYRVGLMRPGSENLIPYALRVYARQPGKDSDLKRSGGFDLMKRFSEALSRRIIGDGVALPIEFFGLFDAVKGTGIIGPDVTWAHTNDLPNVKRIAHAVSIDEDRKPFREKLVDKTDAGSERRVDEVWFAGIHSDVGGGFDGHKGLGKIAMRWMFDAAIEQGVLVRSARYRNRYTLEESDATEDKNVNKGAVWKVAGHKARTVPAGARVCTPVCVLGATTRNVVMRRCFRTMWCEKGRCSGGGHRRLNERCHGMAAIERRQPPACVYLGVGRSGHGAV
jgi:uncharacterized protein (DUF2235 family)